MAPRASIPFLVVMMLLTGVANTILTKYQDKLCVHNCDDDHPARRSYFNQPVLQTAQMFAGEMGCWLVVAISALVRRWRLRVAPEAAGYAAVGTINVDDPALAATSDLDVDEEEEGDDEGQDDDAAATTTRPKRSHHVTAGGSILRGYRIGLLALPAACDLGGTTLMNAGLLLVAASVYQMTRGTLVLFVGLLSVTFLRRHLSRSQWVSLFGVVLGVAIVGLAGALWPDQPPPTPGVEPVPAPEPGLAVLGILLIAGAQILTATQFVLEEWLLANSSIEPIIVVGWEGSFGLALTLVGMAVMHLVLGRTAAGQGGPFDAVEGWRQVTTNPALVMSSVLIMISIGGFNFFGLSVTRDLSSAARSTIDTCRTLFIWLISLGLRWETFKWLQVVGFVVLVYFTFLFHGLVQPPFFLRGPALAPPREQDEDAAAAVPLASA